MALETVIMESLKQKVGEAAASRAMRKKPLFNGVLRNRLVRERGMDSW